MHPHAFYGHADVFFVEYYSRPAGEKSNKSFQIQQITLLICSICIDLRDLDKIGGTSAIEASFMAFGLHNLSRPPGRLNHAFAFPI